MDNLDARGIFKPIFMEIKSNFPQVAEVEVNQNESKEIVILPTDKRVHLIHTVARIGCDACLVLTIEPNGILHVVVTHYDPEHIEQHLKLLKEKTELHPGGKRLSFLITFGSKGDKWNQELIELLTNYQGSNPDIVRLPEIGLKEAEEMGKPENKLKYQLNFTRGYGGDLKKHRLSVPGTDYDKLFTADDLK